MKMAGIFGLTFLFLGFFQTSHGASSSVTINNSINTSNSNTTTSNCETSVRIESNGEVKEYKSEDCGSVDMQSSDGNSRVKINTNQNSNTTTPKPTNSMAPKSTNTPLPIEDRAQDRIDEATKEAQKKVEDIREKQKNFFERLEELIREFFSNLF